MSQSNTSHSSKSIQKNQNSQLTSKTDHTERVSPKAEKPNQQKDVVQNKPKISQPKANAQTAATKESTLNQLSNTEKLDNVSRVSTNAAIKNTAHPCGPCECRGLDCDGEHPMCNNCEWYGRRCSYDWWVRLGMASGAIDKNRKRRTEPSTSLGRLKGSMLSLREGWQMWWGNSVESVLSNIKAFITARNDLHKAISL